MIWKDGRSISSKTLISGLLHWQLRRRGVIDLDPELGRPDPTVGASAQSFLLEANDLVRDQGAEFQ